MYFLGYWNEYAPKTAIFLTLTSCFTYIIAILKEWKLITIGIFFLFLCSGGYFWNGYMDGIIAMFAALAVLSLFFNETQRPQLGSETLLFLSLALSTKNEGMLFSVSFLSIISILFIFKKIHIGLRLKDLLRYSFIIMTPIAYQIIRNFYEMSNDLKIGVGGGSLSRFIHHYNQDGFSLIFDYIYRQTFLFSSSIFLVVTIFLVALYKKKLSHGFIALTIGVTYTAGLILIYMITPISLSGHLGSSIYRTAHIPMLIFFSGIIICISDFSCGLKSCPLIKKAS